MFNDQMQFAGSASQPGVYPFTFSNVTLTEGVNLLTVKVETPIANDQASVAVTYRKATAAEPAPPAITITAPRLNSVIKDASVYIAADITWEAGIAAITVNDAPVSFLGVNNTVVSFKHLLDVSSVQGELPVAIVITAATGQSASKTLTLLRDTALPVITLTTPGITEAPTVTPVRELPYVLEGTVADATLAGFSVNGQPVGLRPGAQADTFSFAVALNLPVGQDQSVSLVARDHAGNQSSRQVILHANVPVGIEIITPLDSADLTVSGATTLVDVAARFTALPLDAVVSIIADDSAPQPMVMDANAGTASLLMNATDGAHTVKIQVHDGANTLLASQKVNLSFTNLDNIPLEVKRTEPANADRGIEPNRFIAVYFNKPVDPALLQVNVKETAHGLTYDFSGQQAANPITDGNQTKLVEVHRDQSPVAGGLGHFPGNTMVAFYPEQDLSYNGDVYVEVRYKGAEVHRFSYKTRPLPTLLQGFAIDQLNQPLSGLTVSLPAYHQSVTTDREGSFLFGANTQAAQSLPGGRTRLVFNPGRKDPRYGEIETWANIEQGRLTEMRMIIVPILDNAIAFTHIQGGQSNIRLAQGELILDLTQAQLTFPSGRHSGDVHVQFMDRRHIPFRGQKAAIPYWLFAVQPMGINVSGMVNVTFTMPALYGSYNYVPPDGTPVLIVGFDHVNKQLIPVGVGEVRNRQVKNLDALRLTDVSYLGYALQQQDAQAAIQEYLAGRTGFDVMVAELNKLAEQVAP